MNLVKVFKRLLTEVDTQLSHYLTTNHEEEVEMIKSIARYYYYLIN